MSSLNAERLSNLEAAETFEMKKKKNKKKLINFSERKNEALRNQKTKSLLYFDEDYFSSIKSLAVEQSTKVNLTTRYLNGKMLMFSKVSIKSFLYDSLMFLCFQMRKFKKFILNSMLKDVIFTKT